LNTASCTIGHVLDAEDTRITSDALRALGANVQINGARTEVAGTIGRISTTEVFLGNSGSSARFLLPLAAFGDRPVRFYGTPRLHERPFAEWISILRSIGYRIDATNDSLPAVVHPSSITGGRIDLGNLPSSQIVSALMMAGLWMKDGISIYLGPDIPSMAYARMTHRLMLSLDLLVEWQNQIVTVSPCRPDVPWTIDVEKDMSAASYWVAYALLTGARVRLNSIFRSSLQGDAAILDVAQMAGSTVLEHEHGTDVVGSISKAFDIDAYETPDLVPTLAVIGMFAPETTAIHNVRHLEYKESNRIEAIQENIRRLGGRTEYSDGNLLIIPQKTYTGASIDTFDDHRIAMSFAIAGLRIPGVVIENPHCVAKSYPRFWEDFDEWVEHLENR
jgi:3-phosphoshikimate 1-carboxyvinyltransferase